MESMLVLSRIIIGELKGDCKIKISLGEEYVLTNEFVLTDSLTVHKTSEEIEFETILRALGKSKPENKNALLRRLGELVSKTDAYDPIPDQLSVDDTIDIDGERFENVKVWKNIFFHNK